MTQRGIWRFVGAAAGLIINASLSTGVLSAEPEVPSTADVQLQRRVNAAFGLIKSDVFVVQIKRPQRQAGAPDAEDAITADVVVNGKPATLQLEQRTVRGPHYRLIAQVEGGAYVDVDPGPAQTYWGSVEGEPSAVAAATLTPGGMFATVRLGAGQQFWLEPLSNRMPGAGPDLYVSYRTEDVMECKGHCGSLEHVHRGAAVPGGGAGHPPHAPAGGEGGTAAAGLPGTINASCFATLACDADREYYQRYGSVSAVNSRIESIINALNVQYASEVGITHLLGTVIVRTSEPDPYSSNDADVLMDQLRDHWNANQGGVPRDIVQLFTGKGLNGGTIGLGYLGVICNNNVGYSLVESDSDPNFGCATDLSAHELGHNWDATHCTCVSPPYTMNPFNVYANHFHPTASIPEITAFRDSVNCIDCGSILSFRFSKPGGLSGEQFGRSLAFIKDVNSDGEPDIIVGCPENDQAGTNAGKVYVISGANGAVLWSKNGAKPGDRFGYAVASSGSTVVVGAPYFDSGDRTDRGRVYIYNGMTGALLKTKTGSKAKDRFGWSVSGGVDVNRDGQPDIIVGAPYDDTRASNAGAVYIFNGGSYTLLKKLTGERKSDCFGWSVAMVGKINSDSWGDFVVGAPFNSFHGSKSGKVYVYSGKTYTLLYPALAGAAAGDQFGRCVASVGNVNGDSYADFAVGAPYADNGALSNAGRLYVYLGYNGTLLFSKYGAAADDQLGSSIATAGDADRDGRDDVLVGTPRNDANGSNAGKVFVFSGRTGLPLANLSGEAAGDCLGTAVAGWSSAGSGRLAMASPLNDGALQSDVGNVYVYATPSTNAAAPVILPDSCAADAAGHDGVVNVADVAAVLERWSLSCQAPCPPKCPQDVNGDCMVDAADFIAVLEAWGTCP
jgi:hypothetical protein